jgi:hypothetical protein
MPTFTSTSGNQKVFVAAAGADHYRIIGLNITKASGVVVDNPLVDTTAGANHIIIDRSLIHGNPLSCTFTGTTYSCSKDDDKQGVQFNNCTYCAVINSWVYDQICYGGAGNRKLRLAVDCVGNRREHHRPTEDLQQPACGDRGKLSLRRWRWDGRSRCRDSP